MKNEEDNCFADTSCVNFRILFTEKPAYIFYLIFLSAAYCKAKNTLLDYWVDEIWKTSHSHKEPLGFACESDLLSALCICCKFLLKISSEMSQLNETLSFNTHTYSILTICWGKYNHNSMTANNCGIINDEPRSLYNLWFYSVRMVYTFSLLRKHCLQKLSSISANNPNLMMEFSTLWLFLAWPNSEH